MRKNTVWFLLITAVLAVALIVGCSQQSPVEPESNATGVTNPDGQPAQSSGEIIPGEYIVVLKTDYVQGLSKRAPVDALNVALAAGVSPRHTYGTVLSGFAAKLTDAQYQALSNNPAVDYIEANRTIRMVAQSTPWGISQINAPAAHARGVKGSGVKVGIIDTGIDHGHPDLAGLYAGGIDYVNGDNDPMDDEGHGTHVSGTVAAMDNTIGVIGVAPSIQLYGVKVLDQNGSGTFADVVAGIDWCAANGMQVANMSLGASVGTSALKTACDNAYASGVVICAAAGNGYGAAVGYPAAYASVIAVSSTDQNNNLSSFSNVGPEVEVAAPGSSIYSTYLGGGYATLSGTSMATPHATGVCALIWSTGNQNSASAVRNQLTSTCTDLGSAGRDNNFGFGLINADAATAGGGGGTNQAPTANANGPYSAQTGQAINFSSAGSNDPDGTIVSYAWDFGDGGTSNQANPTYTYNTAGTYNVTLTVTDDQGATGSNSTTATVTDAPPQNQAPTANANGPYSAQTGQAINFSSAGSNDPDGTIVSYAWDFGDGGTSSAANPTYTYAAAGTYNVTLTVTDDQGATGSNSTTATITDPPPQNQAPTANANGPYSGTAGTAVSFSSAGSNDPDGTIVSYAWDFGDGGTSSAANPTYTYAAAGTYTVTLTVTDDQGATGSNSTTATISSGGGGGSDVVTITKAEYDEKKQKLSVRAESTDPTATLTVVGYGVMTYNPKKNRWELKVQPVSPKPNTVTVTSDKGGSDTSTVKLD